MIYSNTTRGKEFGLCKNVIIVENGEQHHEQLIQYNMVKSIISYGSPHDSSPAIIYDNNKQLIKTLPNFTEETPWNDLLFIRKYQQYHVKYESNCKLTHIWFLNESKWYDYQIIRLGKNEQRTIEFQQPIKTYILFSGEAMLNDKQMVFETFYRKVKQEQVVLTGLSIQSYICVLFETTKEKFLEKY